MIVLFESDPHGLAHRLVVTMDDAEAAWLLGAAEAIAKELRRGEPPQGAPVPAPAGPRPPRPVLLRDQAKQLGYEGDPCNDCGQFMLVRNGTCLKCQGCGATSGCS